jgi:hypothetical protein
MNEKAYLAITYNRILLKMKRMNCEYTARQMNLKIITY